MYSVRTVKNSLRYLYRGAIHENGYPRDTVDELLRELDFKALSAVFRRNARRVYAYDTRENHAVPLEYRGKDLFGKQAVLVYEDTLSCVMGTVLSSHAYEVWLKEDGNFVTVSRVSVNYERGNYETEFREIRGYPWGCGLDLNLERLTAELRELCGNAAPEGGQAE